MSKSTFEKIDEMVSRIQANGCRLTTPYAEPSPLTVLFDGSFMNAEFIPSYPATLHIYGMAGHVAVSAINTVEQVRRDKYIINFGDESQPNDMMIKILE